MVARNSGHLVIWLSVERLLTSQDGFNLLKLLDIKILFIAVFVNLQVSDTEG
jgi:hypothetical protein